eukprot:5879574-Pyramimonas_sp.AAC.1
MAAPVGPLTLHHSLGPAASRVVLILGHALIILACVLGCRIQCCSHASMNSILRETPGSMPSKVAPRREVRHRPAAAPVAAIAA